MLNNQYIKENFQKLGIKDNDRMPNYQFWYKSMELFMAQPQSEKTEKNLKPLWKEFVAKGVQEVKLFELEDTLVPILQQTQAEDGKKAFNKLFIDTQLNLDDKVFFGFLLNGIDNDLTVISTVFIDIKTENIGFLSFMLEKVNLRMKATKEEKEIISFIYSFLNFINEPEVQIIEAPLNPKNNKRRAEKGNIALPANRIIRINGRLKQYVESFNQEAKKGFNHRFWVRGHFAKLKNRKRYKALYVLTQEELNKRGYTFQDQTIRIWRKPSIRGSGILLNSSYKVVKS